MINTILFAFWFFFPTGSANTFPIIATKTPFIRNLSYPIDFGKSFRGNRIFGDHKTIRGFIVGVVSAIVTVYIQSILYLKFDFIRQFSLIDYSEINIILLGFLLGFGSLVGDAVKSFFKRQMQIKSGKTWFPFDQIDYIIGGIIFSALYIKFDIDVYLWIIIEFFLLHPISTLVGYLTKFKDYPW